MAVQMHRKNNCSVRRLSLELLVLLSLFLFTLAAWGATSNRIPNAAILEEYRALYGIGKQEAVDRIAKEAEARRIHHALRDHLGSAWAGAWLDPETVTLVVATTDKGYIDIIRRLGAEAQVVPNSLGELRSATDSIRDQRRSNLELAGSIRASFIDYPTNSVVVRIAPGTKELVRKLIDLSSEQHEHLRLEVLQRLPELSATIRGANCYENNDSGQKCSIGFSVEDDSSVEGYMTAAHCAMDGLDPVSECDSSTAIGDFEASDWPSSDSAWVDTNAPYNPVSEINGYNDGILNVPSEDAGIVEAPLNSTVCRYGRRTGGPHCGQVQEKNMNQEFCTEHNMFYACIESVFIPGVTRTNACLKSGDSGGPFITGDGQAQGTLVGGKDAIAGTCDEQYSGVPQSWFQPVLDTASLYDLAVMTTHGANAPEIYGFTCPDIANSGSETYMCVIDYFDAQGITSKSWSTNTGDSSQSSFLFGTCSSSQTVSVTLTLSNQYGSDQSQTSFPCPTYPIQ